MKDVTFDKESREVLIDGIHAGVGWTEQMDKDIAKFGKKISMAVTKCLFIKVTEKHNLNQWELFRFQESLRALF